MMRTMYMNVARPIVVAGAQSARATSFSLARRSFVSDPYVGNRDERRQDKSKDNGKSAETWKSDKNPQDWKQSGERNFEGMQASTSDRDQTDKGRFDNECGGQGSDAAREQAAREQARESSMNDKGQINQGINNSSLGMSGQAKDDPSKALNYNSSWAKDNATTPTDKAKNNSSRDSNSFGMSNEKAKAKDTHSFDRSNSGDKMKNSSKGMNAPKGKEDSSFGINDLNDQARENQFKKTTMSGSGERDSNSSFGMDERSPTSTRDRVKDGELNASSSGMSDKKQTNSAFGLGNPKRDFSTTKDKAASAAQSVKETASSAAQTIKEKASSAAQTIKEKAGNAEKSAEDYGKQAAEKVKEKAGDAKEYMDKKKNEKR